MPRARNDGGPARPCEVERLEERLLLSQGASGEASTIPPELRTPAILVVPGMLGSIPRELNLKNAIEFLRGHGISPDDLGPAEGAVPYDALLNRLGRQPGYSVGGNVIFAAYDWRLPLAPADRRLDGVLHLNKLDFSDDKYRYGVEYMQYWMEQARLGWTKQYGDPAGFRVNMVGIDEGGLLARSFIQSDYFNHNYSGMVDQVITIGTPHLGFVGAFVDQSNSIGEFLETHGADDDLVDAARLLGLAGNLLFPWLSPLLSLLPVFDFIEQNATGKEAPRNTLLADLNANSDRMRLSVGRIVTIGATALATAAGVNLSGSETSLVLSLAGDGLVLAASAIVPSLGTTRLFEGIQHDSLLRDRRVMRELLGILRPTPLPPGRLTA